MDFSFVTHVSIPNPKGINRKRGGELGLPSLAFSADGTKFAAGAVDGVVSVWDVRSKIPLKVFETDGPKYAPRFPRHLQFNSGILGREVLVFMEVSRFFSEFPTYLSNKWPLGGGSENHPSD